MTLIILVKCTDGLVLAADRAQSENMFSSKEVQKIHKIGDIMMAFAGRVGIIEKCIKLIEFQIASGPFDMDKTEASLMQMLRYYKTKETNISVDGFLIMKQGDQPIAFRVEGDGLCYPLSADPYDSIGAGVFQANPLLNQRMSRNMPIARAVNAVYSVIQDVARFNPMVEGPPSIYTFKGGKCEELDVVALGQCKNEVEFQNTLVTMFHSVINEGDPAKIARIADLLKEFENREQVTAAQEQPAAPPSS